MDRVFPAVSISESVIADFLPFPHSYVGADLSALCQEAANVAVTRIFNELGQRTREAKAAAAKAATAAGEQDGAAVVDLTDTVTEQEYAWHPLTRTWWQGELIITSFFFDFS